MLVYFIGLAGSERDLTFGIAHFKNYIQRFKGRIEGKKWFTFT